MTRINLRTARLALAAGAALIAATVAAGTGLAGGSTTYTDPTGDGNGAPDITTVAVSNDDRGRIAIRVDAGGQAQLGAGQAIIVGIDADRNETTGDDGVDYALVKFPIGVVLERWNGSSWERFSPPSLVARWESGVVFEFDRTDLAVKASFDFYAAGIAFVGDGVIADDAPDGVAMWTYSLTFAPRAGTVTLRPSTPTAGRLLTAGVRVTADGAPIDRGTVACSASVAGRALRPAARSLADGVAGCAWRLPTNARGKVVRGAVTVKTPGGTVTRTFSRKVR